MLFSVFLIISCGDDKAKKETPETNTETTSETPKIDNTYYAWVDNINIRNASNTKGNVIGTYTSKDALEFTGTKSDHKDIIVLRGVVYDDYWLKVTTKDNKQGWVYGGAVKKEGDERGNGIITDNKFDFPYFGKFDLTTWKNMGVQNEEAGDAETQTTTYSKDRQTLEVIKTDVGEYGYYQTYVLKNNEKKILKEREFSFSVDVGDGNNRIMELTETVKDYMTKVQYTRSQKTNKHFMQMNAKPLMVNGTWESTAFTPKK